MFQQATSIFLCIILLLTFVFGSLNGEKLTDDVCMDSHNEDEYPRTWTRSGMLKGPVDSMMRLNHEESFQPYNVTFQDSKGEEIQLFVDRPLLVGEDIPFDERTPMTTNATENPYSVFLMSLGNTNNLLGTCTGSLLSEKWILTAAHCTKLPNIIAIIVYAGGYTMSEVTIANNTAKGSQVLVSKEFYSHPKYTEGSFDADIAVVKVEGFQLTEAVNVVKLSTNPWTYHSYKECKITGYENVRTPEDKLKQSNSDRIRKTHNLMVKNPCLCSFKWKIMFGPDKAKKYICTKPATNGYGMCPGDTGGGLVCDGEVKAVAMQIVQLRDLDMCNLVLFPAGGSQCGSENSMTIFQDTCPYITWINSHVKLFKDSEISAKCAISGSTGNFNKLTNAFVMIFVLICMY